MSQSKRIIVKSDEALFKEIVGIPDSLNIHNQLQAIAAVVQNDIELTSNEFREWQQQCNRLEDSLRVAIVKIGEVKSKMLYHIRTCNKPATTVAPEVESKPRVFNKNESAIPANAVYIGRPNKWGNPFAIGLHGTREEVVDKYNIWLENNPELAKSIKAELKGKDLVCYCFPLACHGDILLKLANES